MPDMQMTKFMAGLTEWVRDNVAINDGHAECFRVACTIVDYLKGQGVKIPQTMTDPHSEEHEIKELERNMRRPRFDNLID